MAWELDDNLPLWPQIKEHIAKKIVRGEYSLGEDFPTVRALAHEAGVNRNTMQRALMELENMGLVLTNRTIGRIVTSDEALIEETKKSLAKKYVDDFLKEIGNLGYSREEIIDIIKGDLQDENR